MVGRLIHSVEERTIPAAVTVGGYPGWGPPRTKYRSAEGSTIMYSRLEKWDGTSRLVLYNHGHGATSSQFGMNTGPGSGAMALARTGRYVVLSIDGGPTTAEWGCGMNMEACRDAVTWARANGAKAGKYAAGGWSMGGLTTLNWLRRDTQCMGAWLWVPAIDLSYFNSDAGYVPDYGSPLPANATWTAEISANPGGAYRAFTNTTAAVTIPAFGTPIGQGVTIPVQGAQRFNDGLFSRGRPLISIGGNIGGFPTYGRKDNTNFYDVIAAGVAMDIPSGSTAIQNYGGSDLGYDPYSEFTDFTPAAFGPTRKVALALTSDDGTIPPAMADAWLAKVANPNIAPTAKSKTLGNHTLMFQYYTDAEIVAFYDSLDWS